MIFVLEEIKNRIEVAVYDNLKELSHSIEWQDVYGNAYQIIDEEGKIYVWDSSKKSEYGTIYGYTLIENRTERELIGRCLKSYIALGKPNEFELKEK